MAKAIQIVSYDGPSALAYADIPDPEPAPGQVAVDVAYAGANYVEALFSAGFVPRQLPWVPGIEAAGRVRALGAGVTGPAPGTPVAALTINTGGGYGEVAVTDARLVAPLPAGLDPAVAAAVPANTSTAFAALDHVARLRPGAAVLVHGAAGGLGSQLGQVARLLGAGRVVGVVGSDGKRDFARRLGYDEIWLRDELAAQHPGQFDLIADPVAGPARLASIRLLAPGGRLLALGDAAQAGDQLISSNDLWLNGTGVLGFNLGAQAAADPGLVSGYLRRALDAVAAGEVVVPVTATVPITSAPATLAGLRSGATSGKIVFSHPAAARPAAGGRG